MWQSSCTRCWWTAPCSGTRLRCSSPATSKVPWAGPGQACRASCHGCWTWELGLQQKEGWNLGLNSGYSAGVCEGPLGRAAALWVGVGNAGGFCVVFFSCLLCAELFLSFQAGGTRISLSTVNYPCALGSFRVKMFSCQGFMFSLE